MGRWAGWTGVIIAVGLMGMALGAYLVLNKPADSTQAAGVQRRKIERMPLPLRLQEKTTEAKVVLYFGDNSGFGLKPEERKLRYSGGVVNLGAGIVTALILGPKSGLAPTVPARTVLNGFYLAQDGTAYVDLSEIAREEHPGGVETEYRTIFSIVDSLIVNISEITQVKILIAGQEAETLAGHIDLGQAFSADMVPNQ